MASTAPQPTPDSAASEEVRPDVATLKAILDGEYAQVRDAAREHVRAHADLLSQSEGLDKDAYRDRVKDVVLHIAATGQTAWGFPVEVGGKGNIGASIASFETMAMGDLSVLVKIGVQFGLFGGAILQLGTADHHRTYLPRVATGELMGCFAMTERGHGSDVQALETTATFDPATDEWVIDTPTDSAHKDFIGNAARHAEMAVVFAQLVLDGESQGVHAFVVPIRANGEPLPGVRIEDCGLKMGLNGVDNGRLWFDGVRVPRAALLDRFAQVSAAGEYSSPIESTGRRFFTMLGTLVQGRVSVGGAGVTAAKSALAIALRYAARRRQFHAGQDAEEQLLIDYGMHQRRLFPLLARTYAFNATQQHLVSELHAVLSDTAVEQSPEDEQRRRLLESRAAGTKALATWHATATIQECREACGGAGYITRNRFTALKADTDVFTTFEGDNHVLLQLVAKGLLTAYSGAFADMDQIGMVKFVAGMAVDSVVEKTQVHTLLDRVRDLLSRHSDDDPEAGLRDSDYQVALLRYREEHLVAGVAKRLKRGVDAGMDSGVVFSRVQDHLIELGRAHVEREVLEDFVAQVKALPQEGPTTRAMHLLCDLYALGVIEEHRAWYLEHGRLSPARSKAITRQIDDLCRRIRPIALDLVAGFDIPEESLRATELIG